MRFCSFRNADVSFSAAAARLDDPPPSHCGDACSASVGYA
jgi:hypothetical protein